MLCAVLGCNNSNYKGKSGNRNNTKKIRFFAFPKDQQLCKQWVVFCGRTDNFNTNTSRICCEHFKNDDFKSNTFLEQYGLPVLKRLNPNTVPSINLPFQPKYVSNRRQTERGKLPQACSSFNTVETQPQQNFSIRAVHSSSFSPSSLPQSQFEV